MREQYAEGIIRLINPNDGPSNALETLRRYTDSGVSGNIAKYYEFIVGSTSPENRFLARVSNGKIDIERDRGQFWIGNKDAFEKYQEYYHSYEIPADIKDEPTHMSVRSRNSLQQVILDDHIANIGDYRIAANDNDKGFMYMLSFAIAQGISSADIMKVEL